MFLNFQPSTLNFFTFYFQLLCSPAQIWTGDPYIISVVL